MLNDVFGFVKRNFKKLKPHEQIKGYEETKKTLAYMERELKKKGMIEHAG